MVEEEEPEDQAEEILESITQDPKELEPTILFEEQTSITEEAKSEEVSEETEERGKIKLIRRKNFRVFGEEVRSSVTEREELGRRLQQSQEWE